MSVLECILVLFEIKITKNENYVVHGILISQVLVMGFFLVFNLNELQANLGEKNSIGVL